MFKIFNRCKMKGCTNQKFENTKYCMFHWNMIAWMNQKIKEAPSSLKQNENAQRFISSKRALAKQAKPVKYS